jgi:hypothetical protein
MNARASIETSAGMSALFARRVAGRPLALTSAGRSGTVTRFTHPIAVYGASRFRAPRIGRLCGACVTIYITLERLVDLVQAPLIDRVGGGHCG